MKIKYRQEEELSCTLFSVKQQIGKPHLTMGCVLRNVSLGHFLTVRKLEHSQDLDDMEQSPKLPA